MGQLLESINAPEDLKKIPVSELPDLCAEIRRQILQTVSENGGHLASNLGAVELTVALHRTFDVPQDVIIWDVGHQAYTHKLLTGRREQFGTIRKKDGLSGFPNREESVCDAFSVGHASTSISAALGFATAKALRKEEGHVVAVIGDGALTGGLAYEGLNNAGRLHRNFIVILNDNEMSISRNVGSISRYLAHIRTTPGYLRAKGNVETILDHIPKLGKPLHHGMTRMKNLVKHIIYGSNFFENLGFTYYGPFDGHDVRELSEVLENAQKINKPVLLHVLTSKGKGYPYAEDDPGLFHGLSGFDINTGKMQKASPSFSSLSRSRRMVSSETPYNWLSSLTTTRFSFCNFSRIRFRLSNASMFRSPPRSFYWSDQNYRRLSIILLSGCAITEESRYMPFSATSSFALSIDADTAETSPVIIM